MDFKLPPIDRGSPVPYYIQVRDLLQRLIEQQNLRPGDRLPSEAQLCDMLAVSRTVIRQALDTMVHEGLLVKEKGRGTFVSRKKISESLVQKLTGFYQDMVDRGHTPVTQVLKQVVVSATTEVAARLQIEPKMPVIEIERLRSVDDEPIVLVTTFLPYDKCPNLLYSDLTNQSLYHVLEHEFGLVIARGHRSIEAVSASDYEARLLHIGVGDPLVMLDSVSYIEDGTPLEYYHAVHRGDRSRFEVELVRVRDEVDLRAVLGQTTGLPNSTNLK